MDDDRQTDNDVSQSPTATRMEFFGSYTHAIDTKGRFIIPNAYRAALGEVFAIGPTRDLHGVALYPSGVFETILAELNGMNQRKPYVQKYTQQFYKLSYPDVQADGQGRVLLPPKLRQRMLAEAKELEISGACNHVRIVDAVKAEEEDLDFMENLDTILDRMGDIDDA